MKKRVMMILMALISLSMIISSFAHAQNAGDLCSSATSQSLDKMREDHQRDLESFNKIPDGNKLKPMIEGQLKKDAEEIQRLSDARDANCQ